MKLGIFFAVSFFGAYGIGFATGYIVRFLREIKDCLMDWLDGEGGAA